MLGGEGNDVLDGGTGTNVLVGGPGNDRLSNGDAHYLGLRREYGFSDTLNAGIATHVISNGPETGVDTLTAIGRASFIDGQMDYSTSSPAAQVARLYDTGFDRVADQDGLNFWSDAVNKGVTLVNVAQAFLDSNEAAARGYAALSNSDFVDRLFQFSVGHGAGTDGSADVARLDAGTATRAQVLAQISERQEHVAASPNRLPGQWVADPTALQAARLYDAALDRLPDAAGLQTWISVLKAGPTLQQVAASFMNTDTFRAHYDGLSNADYVEQLYHLVLNRDGEASGVAGWVASLDRGVDRASVLAAFSESPEHAALTGPFWQDGITLATGASTGMIDDGGLIPLI